MNADSERHFFSLKGKGGNPGARVLGGGTSHPGAQPRARCPSAFSRIVSGVSGRLAYREGIQREGERVRERRRGDAHPGFPVGPLGHFLKRQGDTQTASRGLVAVRTAAVFLAVELSGPGGLRGGRPEALPRAGRLPRGTQSRCPGPGDGPRLWLRTSVRLLLPVAFQCLWPLAVCHVCSCPQGRTGNS